MLKCFRKSCLNMPRHQPLFSPSARCSRLSGCCSEQLCISTLLRHEPGSDVSENRPWTCSGNNHFFSPSARRRRLSGYCSEHLCISTLPSTSHFFSPSARRSKLSEYCSEQVCISTLLLYEPRFFAKCGSRQAFEVLFWAIVHKYIIALQAIMAPLGA